MLRGGTAATSRVTVANLARPHHSLWHDDHADCQAVGVAMTPTIAEADNVLYTTRTMNPAPIHLDVEYAANETEFGRPLVNSLLTLGLAVGLSVLETTHGTTVANLGFEDVVFPAPVFCGGTLHVQTE